jgi:hypothetical protein
MEDEYISDDDSYNYPQLSSQVKKKKKPFVI